MDEDRILIDLHEYILFYGWGILVDIGIIFGRYFKTWKHYILVHSLIFFCLDLLTIIFEAIILNKHKKHLMNVDKMDQDIKNHYIIGITVLVMLIL